MDEDKSSSRVRALRLATGRRGDGSTYDDILTYAVLFIVTVKNNTIYVYIYILNVYYVRQAVNSKKKERKTNQPVNELCDSGIVLYYMYVCIHTAQLCKQMGGLKCKTGINMLQSYIVIVYIEDAEIIFFQRTGP